MKKEKIDDHRVERGYDRQMWIITRILLLEIFDIFMANMCGT